MEINFLSGEVSEDKYDKATMYIDETKFYIIKFIYKYVDLHIIFN